MLKSQGPALAFVGLVALTAIGFIFFDGPHCYSDKNACVTQNKNRSINNDLPSVSVAQITNWATSNREAIEVFSTIASVAFSAVLAISTVLLARRTRGLFLETAGLREAADKQRADFLRSVVATEISAAAAGESFKALLATERGEIIEVIRKINFGDTFWAGRYNNSPTMGPNDEVLSVVVWLKNYGKTPATVSGIFTDIRIEHVPPSIEELPFSDAVLSEPTIPYGEDRGPVETKREISISWDTSNQLVHGTLSIYFIGRIIFSDVFGNIWVRDFAWEFDRDARAFRPLFGATRRGE